MTCYSPLKAFPIGYTLNNKIDYKITSYKVDHIEKVNNKYNESYDENISPYSEKVIRDFKEIPCGRCLGCRLDYSRQWADRCLLEMQYHDFSFFVTLTYDDDHLLYKVDDDGVIADLPSISKREFQLFMKRLRKNYKYNNKLRFFAAGEYGDKSFRPHYHAIIFGLKLDDLRLYKQTPLGFSYYTSDFLSNCWQEKGYVVVAPASWETCAYTARYILKKQKGEGAEIYQDLNIEAPFSLMSRKPGIARQYFDDDPNRFFNQDYVSLATPQGEKKVYPPRYFKQLMQEVDADRYIVYNDLKALAKENSRLAKLKGTSDSYLAMLEKQAELKERRIESLKRSI